MRVYLRYVSSRSQCYVLEPTELSPQLAQSRSGEQAASSRGASLYPVPHSSLLLVKVQSCQVRIFAGKIEAADMYVV